jgi:hypothetical protein
MNFPRMFRVKQRFEGPRVSDIPAAVRETLQTLHLQEKVKPGQTVAVTAGSRGIANIDRITRSVVDELKLLGLAPFIVPTMGSHGEATAEGQRKVLESYGITEAAMGCPIRSSMEVVQIAEVKGIPVFCDRNAWGADHIAVLARIKAHTDFTGEIESGLFKMMAIGLGKRQGAEHYHRAGQVYGYAEVFPLVGKTVLQTARILFGLGIVENGYEEVARVLAMLPPALEEGEKALLRQAKGWMARLPFDRLDLLIVDEMGKNISGSGMDTNVIGRPFVQKVPDSPQIRRIFVGSLTPESQGNASGIGMADLTTRRLVSQIDTQATYINAITSGVPEGAKIPMAFETDREAIRVALGMIGLTPPEAGRVVRIKNTLHLTELDVSEILLPEVKAHDRLTVVTDPAPLAFDATGNLQPF